MSKPNWRLLFWGVLSLGSLNTAVAADQSIPAPASAGANATGFIKVWPGELPLVLSVPHDGGRTSLEIPDRVAGVVVRDSYAAALAEAVREAFRAKYGRGVALVVCELSRKKVDCNRSLAEGAAGQAAAEKVWKEYHAQIDAAEKAVLRQYPHGLYLDLHAHGHPKPRIELGFLLKPADLKLTDQQLDADPTIPVRTSLRMASRTTAAKFSELVRGPTSFGGLLGEHGLAALPSPKEKLQDDEPYFNGAYDVTAHGSRDSDTLDGIQLEVPFGMRDTSEHRKATAQALMATVETFFERHYRQKFGEPVKGPPGQR